jgi:glycyl-tRNA synthetase beta subunit
MLAIYRLAFGQAHQEDFLNDLLKQKDQLSDAAKARLEINLDSLMINLSPIDAAFIDVICQKKAARLIESPQNLKKLLAQVRELINDSDPLAEMGEDESKLLINQTGDLVSHVESAINKNQPPCEKVVAALVHLINPFDAVFDNYHRGFEDDKKAIENAHASLG